jgi:oxygen-independent coproporphyrinogen-3 oxidase
VALPNEIYRTLKPKHPTAYLNSTAKTEISRVNLNALPIEFLMNQLRLKRGFAISNYQAMTGLNINSLQPALATVLKKGLLIQSGENYLCSTKGWLFLDTLLEHFSE